MGTPALPDGAVADPVVVEDDLTTWPAQIAAADERLEALRECVDGRTGQ